MLHSFSNSREEKDVKSSFLDNIQKLNFFYSHHIYKCFAGQSLPGNKKEEKQYSDINSVLKRGNPMFSIYYSEKEIKLTYFGFVFTSFWLLLRQYLFTVKISIL